MIPCPFGVAPDSATTASMVTMSGRALFTIELRISRRSSGPPLSPKQAASNVVLARSRPADSHASPTLPRIAPLELRPAFRSGRMVARSRLRRCRGCGLTHRRLRPSCRIGRRLLRGSISWQLVQPRSFVFSDFSNTPIGRTVAQIVRAELPVEDQQVADSPPLQLHGRQTTQIARNRGRLRSGAGKRSQSPF